MSLFLPFVYYSGITGWNGYLYYSRNSTSIVFDGNSVGYDVFISAGDGLNVRYSRGEDLRYLRIRFLNVQVNYFYPDNFYTLMGGVYGKWGMLFLGVGPNFEPSVDALLERTFRMGRYGLHVRGVGRYYGGYEVPLERIYAWGYGRNEIRNTFAYSITLIASYRLMEKVLYAGFMPVGKRGMDLLMGIQYFDRHLSVGAGVNLFYPIIGSFSLFIGMEPSSGRWDTFVTIGGF